MNWADFVVRGTLVLAAGFAASFVFGRASAALRHFIWTAAFVSLLALPVNLRWAPKIALTTRQAAPVAPVLHQPAAVVAAAASPKESRRVPPTPSSPSPAVFVFAIYLAGLLLVAVRFVAGAIRTSRMVRHANPAPYAQCLVDRMRRDLAIDRSVRALESHAASVPMTWGTRRPVVLLPASAISWPAERRYAVVLHEMVHVQRNDLLAQMAAQAACCLYWFHPLVWLAARQLRKEREHACDDVVVAAGVSAPDYAGHLLELARSLVERRSLADAPAMAETGDLEERVRAVLACDSNRAPLNRRMVATVAALACALVLPVTLVTLRAQTPATGGLAGVVQDISKARVPGCYVHINNLDGKNEEAIRVNAAGEFGFAAIPVGRYAIEVRAPGFAMGKAEVRVEAGRRAETIVILDVGKIQESVTVRGSRPATGSLAPSAVPAPAARAATPMRIPVGGNVQMAKLVRQPRPEYPAELKAQGITGTVMLRAVISTTGEPMNVEVVNTTVNYGLAQAALDAVRQWRYQPTLLNGQPVEIVTNIEVNFELDQ